MLEEFLGRKVVIDLRSSFVCLGTLQAVDDAFLDVRNADLHDLRDVDDTRDRYVITSQQTGIKRNRKRVLLVRAEVVAISLLDDVVDV